MKKKLNDIVKYYQTKESRWGYRIVLGGIKHFGYYPKGGQNISMHNATQNMMDKVGQSLDLPKGSVVLDAGCGEGATAEYLAENYEFKVKGIDLLDFNIEKAKHRIDSSKQDLDFTVGDYSSLDYPDNYFDGIYTLETLVHSPDHHKALSEFNRVLKKGGKLVLFEYSMPDKRDMSKREIWAFDTVNKGSAMHSFPHFIHGTFPKILSRAGFKNCQVQDISTNILPMLRRFWLMAAVPYQFIRLFRAQKKFANTTSAVEFYRYRDKIRYNIVTAIKS